MQIAGAFWYLLAVERKDTCWRIACEQSGKCNIDFLYCGNRHMQGFPDWRRVRNKELDGKCGLQDDDSPFNYGIYTRAIESEIVSSNVFFSKFCYCLWWGLQNLRSEFSLQYITDISTHFHCVIYFMFVLNRDLC